MKGKQHVLTQLPWHGGLLDVGAVRELAVQFGQRATDIDNLLQQLTTMLSGTAWQGADATRFRDDWNSRHAPALRNVANSLRDAQSQATSNAQQQEDASR